MEKNVGFLGDLKTPKGHFEINWPLKIEGWNIKPYVERKATAKYIPQCNGRSM